MIELEIETFPHNFNDLLKAWCGMKDYVGADFNQEASIYFLKFTLTCWKETIIGDVSKG